MPPAESKVTDGWWEQAFHLQPNASEQSGHACGAKDMLTIVGYDISCPRRLAKVARFCEDAGMRVQYSLFECRLPADRFDLFWKGLEDLIDAKEDRITAYKICTRCSREIRDAGLQTHTHKVVAYVF